MVKTRRFLFLTLVLALVLALSLGTMASVFSSSPIVSANEEPEPEPPTGPEEPMKPSSIFVRDLNINPIYAQTGQAIAVDANVVNEGETWGSTTVCLLVNSETEQTKSVGVSPLISYPVSFVIYKVVPGEYKVQIGDETGTFYILADEAPAESAGHVPIDTGGYIAIVIIGLILASGLVVVFMFSRGM